MSDRLAVMHAGRIAQIGTPREVYEEPTDSYVADFLGAANLIEISVIERTVGSTATLKLGESVLTTSGAVPASPGETAQAVIRPERIRVEEHGSAGVNRVPAMVERVVYLGAATQVMLRLATGESLQAVIPNDESAATWAQGTPVHCCLPVDAIRVRAPAAGASTQAAESLAS
jgi:spermidine/putrescine transport system ATP-binding protein